jgi:dihydropteroate synthase
LLRLNSFLEHKNDNFYHSIDTFNPIVAEEAFQNNFSVVNDVSGAQDQRMITTLRKHSAGLILTHRNNNSSSIHDKVDYKDIVKDVKNDLRRQVRNILDSGVNRDQIAIDVGLGFGKTQEQSATLLESISQFVGDYPLVVGYSRKKFTQLLKTSDEELLNHCQNQGVSLVRLHFID